MIFSRGLQKKGWAKARTRDLRAISAAGSLVLILGSFVMPVNFVTEHPGPTFNTIGKYQDHELMSIEGMQTYPANGNLDMTTVSVAGGPNSTVGALGVFSAWLEDSASVLPSDLLYAPRLTTQEVSQQNSAEMTNSQEVAQAAALTYLGVDFTERLKVSSAAAGGPGEGKIEPGDIIEGIGGTDIRSYQDFTAAVNASQGAEITVRVNRKGQEQDIKLTPVRSEETGKFVLGLYIARDFDFPMTVKYGLEEVGGPSAGMMFSLGIIDELTAGDMTGGQHFAGTGTIDVDGSVGGIGGIAQKMRGASDTGATVFLAPAANCDEVVGNVPEGLHVIKVETLSEAVDAVTKIGQGEDPSGFPTCS
ncbi:MAG: PDZ domain-containing protein [Rothia sp. (in: high G+C Gram-positive bacteria)]|nr:PDZ domain-containing protein [Rothia sp. (in: high G+C Gram-positive bacteria)]